MNPAPPQGWADGAGFPILLPLSREKFTYSLIKNKNFLMN
jgi:hypothetical protein